MNQEMDLIMWKGVKWEFCGTENVYNMFAPENFGLIPDSIDPGCYRGFATECRVVKDTLYLHSLTVNTVDGNYPDIAGVKAVRIPEYKNAGAFLKTVNRFGGYHLYDDLDMKLPYTGTIVIGRELRPENSTGSILLSAFSYGNTYELYFEDGRLTGFLDTSRAYAAAVG